jgi:hypothetical protein
MDAGLISRNSFVSLAGLLLTVLLSLGIQGCTTLSGLPTVENGLPSYSDPDLKAWEEAMRAFEEGEYQQAMALFEVLSESAEDDFLARRALYAFAVTRLILAQTPEEFTEAMGIWECWSNQSLVESEGEDPRLLSPLLESLTPPDIPKVTMVPAAPKPRQPVKNATYSTSLLACKNQLQSREKEIERLKARFEAKEREVRRLKHQIESLEKIHLKFQERKLEASAP